MNKNTNCLEDISCPQCRQADRFKIASSTWSEVTDDGSETIGDVEWDDSSQTICLGCDYKGPLSDFREYGPKQTLMDVRSTLMEIISESNQSSLAGYLPEGTLVWESGVEGLKHLLKLVTIGLGEAEPGSEEEKGDEVSCG